MSLAAEFAVTRFFNGYIYFFYRKQISLKCQENKNSDDVFLKLFIVIIVLRFYFFKCLYIFQFYIAYLSEYLFNNFTVSIYTNSC